MSNLFFSFLSCIAFSIYAYLAGVIIFQKKVNDKKKILFAFVVYTILFYLIVYRFSSLYANLFSCIVFVMFYMILFSETNFLTLYVALVTYTGKLIFRLLFLIISDDYYNYITVFHEYNLWRFLINIIIAVLAFILIFILKKHILKFKDYLSKKKHKEFILLVYMSLNVFLNTVIRIEYFEYSVFITADLAIIFILIYFMMINTRQENRIVDIQRHYNDYVEYSKLNEELISNYKMRVHENSNRLLIIKGMIKGSKKDLEKYIDTLLEEDHADLQSNWLAELKYIPFPGIKNFINYKLNKLKKIGAEIELVVSADVKNLNVSKLSSQFYSEMCTIIGVILDNMVDALQEEEKKLASIHLYVTNNVLHGEFVNHFTGEVDLDKINDVGYTTKGKNHGVGLSLVKRIIDSNKWFDFETKILDEFFIQHVMFDMNIKTQ
ncbi:MAG: GHKL domain-containing protein [Bacilli bacterium]|nr:GHKL domain-containing protein [Bacilli bacterium]